jgi:hypothetical protein
LYATAKEPQSVSEKTLEKSSIPVSTSLSLRLNVELTMIRSQYIIQQKDAEGQNSPYEKVCANCTTYPRFSPLHILTRVHYYLYTSNAFRVVLTTQRYPYMFA